MRLNQFIALSSGLSRRDADEVIKRGHVRVNGQVAVLGQTVSEQDKVIIEGQLLRPQAPAYIVLNKPVGYVVSRLKQGKAPTIYALLPESHHHLKPVGRLDEDSCGLLLLTNDGKLANQLTHPRYGKTKRYQITLTEPLKPADRTKLEQGIELPDGTSRLRVLGSRGRKITVSLAEGRNRQVRRTLGALGYRITKLERVSFGRLDLGNLAAGQFRQAQSKEII